MSSGRMKEISMLKEEGRRSKKRKGNVFFWEVLGVGRR